LLAIDVDSVLAASPGPFSAIVAITETLRSRLALT